MKLLASLSLACLLGILSGCDQADRLSSEAVAVGKRVPTFSLRSVDGSTVTSESLEGSPVILNFWATWCGPCMGEIPDLKQVADTSAARVIGIALDEGGAKAVKAFVERNGIKYTVLLGNQDLFQHFDGYAIPYTLVVDRSRKIVRI